MHAICDGERQLFRFRLTPGKVAAITAAYALVPLLPSQGDLSGDAGYDAQQLRQDFAFRGTTTVIPTSPTRKHQWPINRESCKRRNLVERMFNRLKNLRRIATRYDKLARNVASGIALAAIVLWWAK